ncbi:MAG: phage holin family protein, partial [Myxococcota bacterium]
MLEFAAHVVFSAFLIAVVGRLVSGVEVEDAFAAVVAAVVLGIANAVVRPLLVVLTFPLTILTLGLFLLVVNVLVLWLVSAVVPGFGVRSFGSAFVGALV